MNVYLANTEASLWFVQQSATLQLLPRLTQAVSSILHRHLQYLGLASDVDIAMYGTEGHLVYTVSTGTVNY